MLTRGVAKLQRALGNLAIDAFALRPAIDASTGNLFVAAKTKAVYNGETAEFSRRQHALQA